MKTYDVIIADPPWSFNDKLTMSDVKRGADAQYDGVLTLDDIKQLPVRLWAAENAVLALWVPSSMLYDGLTVMADWGFTQKQIYTWVKTTKGGGLAFGMGRQFRGCTEHALIGTRGSPKPLSKSERGAEVSDDEANVELALNMGHSVKPDGLHERLTRMYPLQDKLELFARRNRPGWTTVGNENPGTEGVDLRTWSPPDV